MYLLSISCVVLVKSFKGMTIDFCKNVRNIFPDKIIVAGNVVTREIVEKKNNSFTLVEKAG